MSERFNVDTKWESTDDAWNCEAVGYFIVDDKNNQEVYLYVDDKPLVFKELQHAEIFARLMNFGASLKGT